MRRLSFIILLSLLSVAPVVVSCSSSEVKFLDAEYRQKDNLWLSDDILQLRAIHPPEPENTDNENKKQEESNLEAGPVTLRYKQNCSKVEQAARKKLEKLYPKAAGKNYELKEIHTIYHPDGACEKIYHIEKEKLKGSLT